MRKAKDTAQRAGALGIRVQCSGRLGGAEMSRSEFYREGRVPLHTLRADIDYGFFEARTPFGRIGVKVWIYKGDLPTSRAEREALQATQRAAAARRAPAGTGPRGAAPRRGDRPQRGSTGSTGSTAAPVAAPVADAAPAAEAVEPVTTGTEA
jgi:small subunit ribosomal protein S3